MQTATKDTDAGSARMALASPSVAAMPALVLRSSSGGSVSVSLSVSLCVRRPGQRHRHQRSGGVGGVIQLHMQHAACPAVAGHVRAGTRRASGRQRGGAKARRKGQP